MSAGLDWTLWLDRAVNVLGRAADRIAAIEPNGPFVPLADRWLAGACEDTAEELAAIAREIDQATRKEAA
jgi:hypothetical protein